MKLTDYTDFIFGSDFSVRLYEKQSGQIFIEFLCRAIAFKYRVLGFVCSVYRRKGMLHGYCMFILLA